MDIKKQAIYYFFGFEIEFNQLDSLRILILYFFSVTLIRAISYDADLPEFASSSFSQYISLRLLKLLGFLAVIWFIYTVSDYIEYDKIIKAKSGYLEPYFFLIRGFIYLGGWSLYRYFSRKFSIAQDNSNDNKNHIKNFKLSAGFLVFFLITESMMSWDWIMSIDPHWFSTLFGWYVFASMMVSGVTTIALISIYLKSKGYLPNVNDNHIHDLGKFMFGFSVFWTYLWFSQFMLIWYSNIPEEVVYFISRIEDYTIPFWGMVVINFILPFLILVSSNFKRVNSIIVTAGIIILTGHYIDVYNMIMPSAVGDMWSFGAAEVGGFLFFLGIFIYVVFKEISKAPILVKGDPFIEESKTFQYYNLD